MLRSGLASNRSDGINRAIEVANSRVIHDPNASPSAAPANASTALSVSNCRTMRARPPPSARRTAISFFRAVARASSMFAMLRQAMSSTPPDSGISTADIAAGPESVDGDELMLTRDIVCTVSS
jgi:hypothetical protein